MKKQLTIICLTVITVFSLKAQEGYIHNPKEGDDESKMFPPDYIHCQFFREQSRMFPSDYRHNNTDGPDKSEMFPPNYVHRENSKMIPPYFRHNPMAGPEQSKYFDTAYKHNPIAGPDQSKMFPRSERHNPIAGVDHSKMFPRGERHNPIAGVDHSKMFPGFMTHNPVAGPDVSKMFEPDMKHSSVAGDDFSKMVSVLKHIPDGEDASGLSQSGRTEYPIKENIIIGYSSYGTTEEGSDKSKNTSVSPNSILADKLQLDVYPNPVANEVNISPIILPDFVTNATFTLINIEGKMVMTQTISNADITGNTLKLTITELPTGIYIGSLNVNGKNIIHTGKIIKK